MQPYNVDNPRPGNDNNQKRRARTFWLLVVIAGLLAAISVILINRL